MNVAVQLTAYHQAMATEAILDAGAGPSVIREDILSSDWRRYAYRSPKSTRICDASGQLLRALAVLEAAILIEGKVMVFSFQVVKALSVPGILGMDFKNEYVRAIYPGAEAVRWYDDFATEATRV